MFLNLKWLVTQRCHFFVGFPTFCYITWTFKRTSLSLFRFKISQCAPFLIKNRQSLSKICKKGTNREILNLNIQRLGTCYITKKSLVLKKVCSKLTTKNTFCLTSFFCWPYSWGPALQRLLFLHQEGKHWPPPGRSGRSPWSGSSTGTQAFPKCKTF